MPRKRKEQPEGYNKPLPESLRKLLDQTRHTRQEIAEYLGISRQAVSYYCDGSTAPDWETLAALAVYFGVSADFLIGLSDVREVNPELRAICEYTGLSEAAVNSLHSCAESGALDQLSALLAFLGSDGIKSLNGYLTGAIKRAKPVKNYTRASIYNAYGLLLSPEATRSYYEDRALDVVRTYIATERAGISEQEDPDVYEIFGPPIPKMDAGQEEG